MIYGEVKVWREDAWVEVAVAPEQFTRYVRHTPVRAMVMNEDFTCVGQDGRLQQGAAGDVLILDDGFLHIAKGESFGSQNRQVAEGRIDPSAELDQVRETLAAVMLDILVSDRSSDDEGLAYDLADGAMALMAVL